MHNLSWVLRMAFRDFRQNKAKLALFVISIIAGIAALVAINSFAENLTADLAKQAKELAGADLTLSNNQPIEESALDTLALNTAQENSFASMVVHLGNEESRLTQIRALEGPYPFYGTMRTSPEDALSRFELGEAVVIAERILLLQLDAQIGDTLLVGSVQFEIVGIVESIPGQTGIVSSVAPAAFIPMNQLEATGLVQYGSRVNYNRYYKLAPSFDLEAYIEKRKATWEEKNIRYETVESRQQSTGKALGNLANFLSLVAFIALLLGSVGVGSSVNVFIKEKLLQVATLRCLGVSSGIAFSIFLFQILIMAILGSSIGAAIGTLLQFALPIILEDFLPVKVSLSVSWSSIWMGIGTGVLISVLFSMLPLLKIRSASPMMTLRPESGETSGIRSVHTYLVYTAIGLFIFGFSFYLTSNLKIALGFTFFVILSFVLLWGTAKVMMLGIRRFFPSGLPYPIRQSLANLYRPNNQTINLIATIGIGTAMISTLYFVQTQLLAEVRTADKEDQPNMLLFDIQDHQKDSLKTLLTSEGLPILQEVPIVTMRLVSINGLDKKANELLPEEEQKSKGLFQREYRNTYRDTLLPSETIIQGQLKPISSDNDSIFISVERDFAKRTGLNLNDQMVFNVQGRLLTTYIGSFRDIKVNQVSTIFLFLFPEGLLEKAPKFHVLITKTESEEQSAEVQKAVLRSHPNVSVINLSNIIDVVEEVLGKVGFVIQFMALFSIVTGFLVLISALMISRYQRMRESILLRTIGAGSKLIRSINTMEYLFLGSIASGSGIILSLLASWSLSYFVFDIGFSIDFPAILILFFGMTSLVLLISLWNGRKILTTPPMEILRGGSS